MADIRLRPPEGREDGVDDTVTGDPSEAALLRTRGYVDVDVDLGTEGSDENPNEDTGVSAGQPAGRTDAPALGADPEGPDTSVTPTVTPGGAPSAASTSSGSTTSGSSTGSKASTSSKAGASSAPKQ